jgi:hypothetical protein
MKQVGQLNLFAEGLLPCTLCFYVYLYICTDYMYICIYFQILEVVHTVRIKSGLSYYRLAGLLVGTIFLIVLFYKNWPVIQKSIILTKNSVLEHEHKDNVHEHRNNVPE